MIMNSVGKDISIIIVCFKGLERLGKCLDALNEFKDTGFTAEVIVVDNDPEGDALRNFYSRYPEFRFIQNKVNGGFGNGCNVGSDNSSGEFLLFLNPDTVPSGPEINKLLVAARSFDGNNILSCRQISENGKESRAVGPFPDLLNLTGLLRTIFRERSRRSISVGNGEDNQVIFPDWLSGSVLMMKKSVFTELRGFDEDYWMYYEDVDLCKRLSDAGGKTIFFKNITIEHNHGGSTRINPVTTGLTKCEVRISQHVYIRKHKTGLTQSFIQLFLVVNNLISGIFPALAGLLIFFKPRLYAYTIKYAMLLRYYAGALFYRTWISKRSVNSKRNV